MEEHGRVPTELLCHELRDVIGASIKQLAVDVLILNVFDLFSFMDLSNDELKFQITVAQVSRNVSSKNISQEKKKY